MKVCPVCKARVFDDMDTCYGCLHRFDSSDVEKAHGGGFEPEESPGYSGKARNLAEAEEKKKGARPADVRAVQVSDLSAARFRAGPIPALRSLARGLCKVYLMVCGLSPLPSVMAWASSA